MKKSVLATLDREYMAGVAELYTNEPRQFHVRVPCHSRFNRSHHCSSPATIVFRVRDAGGHCKLVHCAGKFVHGKFTYLSLFVL